MKMNKRKKIVAGFELMVVLLSIFSFSYIISESNYFQETKQKQPSLFSKIKVISKIFVDKLKEPIIPLASAAPNDVVCCMDSNSLTCETSTEGVCDKQGGSNFYSACEKTPECKKGCCVFSNGNAEDGVIKQNCIKNKGNWNDNVCSQTPNAQPGCCVLKDRVLKSVTETYCQIKSKEDGLSSTDWTNGMSDEACSLIPFLKIKGACVASDGTCIFTTGDSCSNKFYPNMLCSAGSSIGSICGMPDLENIKTTCVGDKVYFLDNCSQQANIYDKDNYDSDYWTRVYTPDKSCGTDDSNGNADSTDCGNCNRVTGGICSSIESFSGEWTGDGNNYCENTGCKDVIIQGEGTVDVKNGDKWCVYDGKVGDGDDIVGSSHWIYQCSFGEVTKKVCGNDYRGQICAGQKNDDGRRTAQCQFNNWRTCINLNSAEGGLDKETCEATPTCMLKTVDLGGKYFNFTTCMPEYPSGFDIGLTEKGISTAIMNEIACNMGDITCVIPRVPQSIGTGGGDGGCLIAEDEDEIIVNKRCTSPDFIQEMNDFCRGLGDCGGSINVNGVISESYKVIYNLTDMENGKYPDKVANRIINETVLKQNTQFLNATMKKHLIAMNIPSNFNSVSMADYRKLLEALGISPVVVGEDYIEKELFDFLGTREEVEGYIGKSALSAGGAAFYIPISKMAFLTTIAPVAIPVLLTFAGTAAGYWVMKILGVEGKGTIALSAIAGGLAGFGLSAFIIAATGAGAANVWNPIGWIALGLAVIAALIVGHFAANEDDCEPIEIKFDCKPWLPPAGGKDCHLCNEDPDKCNSYRCHSLGRACEFIQGNKVGEQCQSIKDDFAPPIMFVDEGTFLSATRPTGSEINSDYNIDSAGRFATAIATDSSNNCFNARDMVSLGINISEPALCKYSFEDVEFDKMTETFGTNAHLKEQILLGYRLPDLSRGVSQGTEWSEEMKFYIRCEDVFEDKNYNPYLITLCVNQGPDENAPEIISYKPENGGLTGFDTTSQQITFITDEAAGCNWSLDQNGASPTPFECIGISGTLDKQEYYTCKGNLPITTKENIFYINCTDQPWEGYVGKRNSKLTKYVVEKPENKIEIRQIEPDEDYKAQFAVTTLEMEIATSGGGLNHKCIWSKSGFEKMVDVYSESGNIHKFFPYMQDGNNKIYVNCTDETGDMVSKMIEINVDVDEEPPIITRINQRNGKITIMTDEIGVCKYSTEDCNFDWEEAQEMTGNFEYTLVATKGQIYYIICKDEYGNSPSGCTKNGIITAV